MDFRFVHAADLHLGSPFRGLVVEERLRALVEDATFRAFERIVSLCLSERAAFLVLAGDLFDSKDRSVRARVELAQQLFRLDQAGIPTFIVHGNHDPLLGFAPGTGLPPSVHVFGAAHEEVEVRQDGVLLARVQGISYPREEVTENLSLQFGRKGPQFTVGLLHANLAGGASSEHKNYAPCTLSDLEAAGLDYWALGHVHTRSVQALSTGAQVVYPGNPQGRHVNEPGPRGCAVVDVRDGRAKARFVDLEEVRWHRLEVDVSDADAVEAVASQVLEGLRESAQVQDPKAHAARVTLVGRTPVHKELSAPEEVESLEALLRRQAAALTPPWALESLRVETKGPVDWDAVRAEDGLAAAVLQSVEEDVLEALWAEEDLRKLAGRLKGALGEWPPKGEGLPLLEAAAQSVVERLVEEEG